MLFAVVGTIVNFSVTAVILNYVNNNDLIYTNSGHKITLSDSDILYFSATMCATDAIASLTLIKPKKYPKLFSVISGEGLVIFFL